MIIVSACLCGINTRYDGKSNLNETTLKLLKEGKAVLVCPEQLGGMSTPRLPHEIVGGDGAGVLDGIAKVISADGNEGTDAFLKGAYETLKIAKEINAEYAILKAKSPSCGYGKIYNGIFSGEKISGNGVTAELLSRNGIKVYTEEDIENIDT
ncbi:DUF523 domain-containing protein [Clostridium sp. YIM B02515]|uniref:DUF523 domain-containing protein n=1 Tax=Clostridium rhizosphaerae TaxID=2803861 RepID=A0ABS1TGE5_9CLOT|nr:DUF523 domain-containing protein [Clostridium rhizosphaerae]MBL4938157.1 DUF523 domain-containing protein [Clostridium rhizosphaerae]